MELALPIGGIRRDIDDAAATPGAFRDILGATVDKDGSLTGVYRGRSLATFDGVAATRFIQWGDRYVRLKTNPAGSPILITDGSSYQTGPTGDGRACKFGDYLPMAVSGDQAMVLIDDSTADPFTNSACYLSQNIIEATVSSSSGSGSVTLTLSGAAPNTTYPTGMVPRYVLFDADAAGGAMTAQIRPVTAYTASPGPATSVTYTGDAPPAGTVYVRLLMGTSATDTFKPDGFFVWRGQLCAWKDEYIYYSGYPGSASPYIVPNPSDWTYWYALNVSTTGTNHNIIRCVVVGDSILAFTETGRVFRFDGWPPIDGTDNQVTRIELHPDLSIPGYDAVAVTNDGKTAYFIGTDGLLYSTAMGEISKPIRDHEKLKNMTMVTTADQAVIFSGDTPTPESVARDAASKPSGFMYQFPCTFYLNAETGHWSTWQPLGFDSTGALVPMDDPASLGGIGTITQDGRERIAVGSKQGIHVINDPNLSPAATDWHTLGVQTHAYAADGLATKQVTAMTLMAESPALAKLGMATPADSPMSLSNAKTVRAEANRVRGNSRMYCLRTQRGLSNTLSAAVGYMGETLLDGTAAWPVSRTATALGGGILLCPMYMPAGLVSRYDVLMSSLTDCDLEIYEDDGADAPDFASLVYSTSVKEAHAGLTGTGEYWHAFDVRLTLDAGTYWFGLRGTASIQRTGSGRTIVNGSGVAVHTSAMFIGRAVRELGCPNAAKKITSMAIQYNKVGRPW